MYLREEELERELRRALARKDAPLDFADRVVAAARRPRLLTMPRWMAAAAALVVMAGGGVAYRRHEGMVAKDQVMLAARITAGQLNRIQAHVREVRP